MDNDVILVIVVGTALAFDYTNGFHDTANVVATSISTKAMPPRLAVAYASVLNFAGAFLSIAVAATIAQDVVASDAINPTVVFAGLVGAIAWNLTTWYYGLPSSSSHALIGGVVGAAFVAGGADAVLGEGVLGKVLVPAVVAPILAFIVGGIAIVVCYRTVGRLRPGPVTRGYRLGQVVSGGLLALAHGTNDAQKTMGVITLALIANGNLPADADPPTWVIVSAATAIALGTYSGRLADHPHDGDEDHQDGRGPGLLGPGSRGGGHPRLHPLRLSAVDHPGDLGRGDGRRGRQAAVRGSLGGGGEHRHRLAPHAAGGGGHRSPRLRRDAGLRHRVAGPGDRDRDRPGAGRGSVRPPDPARRAGGGAAEAARCWRPSSTPSPC